MKKDIMKTLLARKISEFEKELSITQCMAETYCEWLFKNIDKIDKNEIADKMLNVYEFYLRVDDTTTEYLVYSLGTDLHEKLRYLENEIMIILDRYSLFMKFENN